MCLIVDANCASMTFRDRPSEDFLPVIEALFAGNARLVLGGTKLREEYGRIGAALRAVASLDRAGKVIHAPDVKVDMDAAVVAATGECKSDDEHIVALVRVSGARLVCTRDLALHQDLANKNLIPTPRASIYQKASHAPLIRRHCK